jgi:hypothetical protein
VVDWEWILESSGDSGRHLLRRLVQFSDGREGTWRVVGRDGLFLLCSPCFVGVEDPAEARTRAQALLDALIGVLDVLDMAPMRFELGNAFMVTPDG